MRAAGVPETTIRVRRYYVDRLSREVGRPLVAVRLEELEDWMAAHEWAPNTRKSARTSLRAFYGYCRDRGLVEISAAHQLPPVRVPRGRPKPTPEQVFRQAMAAHDARVVLAVRLAGQCGLRRGEIAGLHTRDVEHDLLGPVLRVRGKGGHTRMVPLPPDLADELLSRDDGWIFPSTYGDGRGHLTGPYLARLVRDTLQAIEQRAGTTHGLRHRAATVAYAGTKDLRAVQELLGHSRPETTAAYVEVPQDAVRAAMMAAAA